MSTFLKNKFTLQWFFMHHLQLHSCSAGIEHFFLVVLLKAPHGYKRLRSLYRHQHQTCVYSVSTASIIFIIWTTKVLKMVDCQTVSLFSVALWLLCVFPCSTAMKREFSFRLFILSPRCVHYHCRVGGTCGWMMPSGVSCSPPSCWSLWCCCDPLLTTRGQSSSEDDSCLLTCSWTSLWVLCSSQVLSFSSDWRRWWWRGREQGAHAERGLWWEISTGPD